jgi:hypothetical protein
MNRSNINEHPGGNMKLSEIKPEDITVDQAELVRRILFHGTETFKKGKSLIMLLKLDINRN